MTFSSLLLSGEGRLIGFCFNANVNLSSVKSYLGPILARGDRVYSRGIMNCVEIPKAESRFALFEKWLNRRYRIKSSYVGSGKSYQQTATNHVKANCKILIRKETKGQSTSNDISIQKNGRLSQTVTNSSGGVSSRLLLGTGKKGHIRVNSQRVGLVCTKKGADNYEIDVSLEARSGSVSTSVQVSRGNRINIGQVVEDLNNRSRNLDINRGANFKNTKGQTTHNYYLSIE